MDIGIIIKRIINERHKKTGLELEKIITKSTDLENGDTPLLAVLKRIKEIQIKSWSSQGTNGNDFIEYKIHNGAFTYHKNKKKTRFPISSQRYCAEESWGPKGQILYYDTIELALKIIEDANLTDTDNNSNSPLTLACLIGEPELIKSIIAKNSEIDIPNKDGETPLHKIAESNRLDGIKIFIKEAKGKELNFKTQDNAGWTALHHAVQGGNEAEIVNILLKKKIDVTLASTQVKKEIEIGATAASIAQNMNRDATSLFKTEITLEDVIKAIKKGNKTEVEKYLTNGGDIEAADETANLLIRAVIEEQAAIVQFLLRKGANPNAVYHSNINGLMLNVINLHQKGQFIPQGAEGEYMEHVKIAEAFINNDVDLATTREGDNQTALRVAADISDDITIMILKKLTENNNKVAIINTRDSEGFTALHMASKRGTIKTIDSLIELGADVSLGDNDNFIPLHEGIIANQFEAVKFLVEKGSDIKQEITGGYSIYNKGDNAIDMAKKKGDKKMIAFFENN